MTDLRMTHTLSGSPRVVQGYVQPEAFEEFALEADESAPSGRPKIRGDRLGLPEEIVLRLYINEGNLADSADLAYLIVSEAETATTLEWHEGFVSVKPVRRVRMRPSQVSIDLELTFPKADSAFISVGDGTSYDGVDLGTGL